MSITSSVTDYKYENGRRYHAYREGKYLLPNDEAEQDRLDLHHHIFRLMLGGHLYRAPISAGVQRVLDYGTGTGIWAIDFADEYPAAIVIGTDLSPIQPEWAPPNCKFYVDDVESDWVFKPNEAFDFIHGRSMCGSIFDFDALYGKCYKHLKPGGWVELQEFEAWIWQIDDPESKKIPNISKWLGYIDEASTKIGKRFNVATKQKQKLIDAGFINVHDDIYPVFSATKYVYSFILTQSLGSRRYLAKGPEAQRAWIVSTRAHDSLRGGLHSGPLHSCPRLVHSGVPSHHGGRER